MQQRKRFQVVIADVLGPDAALRATPSRAQLQTVAGRLVESDIDDIRQTLDALSTERDTVPDWDGDTHDDIARAEATLTTLLRLAETRGPVA